VSPALSSVLGSLLAVDARRAATAPVVAAISDKSIAVLPFVDMSEKRIRSISLMAWRKRSSIYS